MKAFLVLTFVGLATALTNSYPRGCIYANGICVQECPEGTMSYSIDCGFVTKEATCRDSRPKPATKKTCGYSACHCVAPTVRDEKSGQCVHLDKCPGARIIKTHHGGVPKIQRRPVAPKAPVAPVAPTAPVAPQAPQAPQWPQPQLPLPPSHYNGNYY